MTTKHNEVYSLIRKLAEESTALASAEIADRAIVETIRVQRKWLATCVADRVVQQYNFLELLDILEWKRQRVRR